MRRVLRSCGALTLVVLCSGLGCGPRVALADGFGRDYRALFARQATQDSTPQPAPLTGDEAALILQRYRRTLAAGGQASAGGGAHASESMVAELGTSTPSAGGGIVLRSR